MAGWVLFNPINYIQFSLCMAFQSKLFKSNTLFIVLYTYGLLFYSTTKLKFCHEIKITDT